MPTPARLFIRSQSRFGVTDAVKSDPTASNQTQHTDTISCSDQHALPHRCVLAQDMQLGDFSTVGWSMDGVHLDGKESRQGMKRSGERVEYS